MKLDIHKLRLPLPATILALLSIVILAVPVAAELIDPGDKLVNISSNVTGGGIEANDTYVALIYHSAAVGGQGIVYVKSATDAEGWLTSTGLGFGAQPQIAFDPDVANEVYGVWKDSSGDNEQIKYAHCVLDPIEPPDCTTGVIYTAPSNQFLQATDIALGSDPDNSIHVAWENLTTHQIWTAQATTSSLGSWPTTSVPTGGSQDSLPVLAWSSGSPNSLHLAFLRGTSATQPTQVVYMRNDRSGGGYSHEWSSPDAQKQFSRASEYSTTYDYIVSRPTIAVSGSDVYLAWDAYSSSETGSDPQKHFGLMRVSSGDGGNNWTTPATLITSDDNAVTNASADKYSYLSGPPQEQIALRPSMVISGSGLAVVWQASPDASGCGSEPPGASTANAIYFAHHNGTSWVTEDVLDNNRITHESNIAPDVAIPTGGPPSGWKGHFIFMRDSQTTANCAGGNYNEYTLYYWGPFTKTFRDQGEPGTYLPIILRNG